MLFLVQATVDEIQLIWRISAISDPNGFRTFLHEVSNAPSDWMKQDFPDYFVG